MKGGAEHRVPLSDAAVDVVECVRSFRDRSDLLFPSASRPGKPLGNMTWAKLLRTLRINAVPHGFRSSFRDCYAETGKPREVAEAALAHTYGDAVSVTPTAYPTTSGRPCRRLRVAVHAGHGTPSPTGAMRWDREETLRTDSRPPWPSTCPAPIAPRARRRA